MIKKDKVFELKIEEDDELSGIDSISLVDEPAIEINWMYFSKEKEHGFNIPDGEDLKYSEMITQKGQSEEELLNDGWELHSMEHSGKEEFISSSPNSSSIEDTDEYLIRYKYILNPEAPGAPIKETTREFCKDLLKKNLVYRVEDLDTIVNDLGSSALVWRGSYNCRHLWSRLTYRRGPKPIENNGSVRTGRLDTGLELGVLGYPQPNTRTSNPSFSKEKFESYSDYGDGVKGNAKRGRELNEKNGNKCATQVGKIRSSQLEAGEPISLGTIKRMYSYLSRAETYYDETDMNTCGTISFLLWGGKAGLSWSRNKLRELGEIELKEVFVEGCPTATQDVETNLKNRQECIDVANYGPLNPNEPNEEYWKNKAKMFGGDVESSKKALCGNCSFFVKTKSMLDCIATGINDVNEWDTIESGDLGYCEAFDFKCASSRTCDAWVVGGPIVDEDMGYDNNLPSYVEQLPKKKKSQKFQTDEEKRTIIGPCMVPNLRIPRKDSQGNTYEIFFSPETIKMIAEKYMKNKYTDNNDMMHDGRAINDVYVVESWIKEDMEDKSNKYGYQDTPIGTWFVAMKCAKTPEGDKVWNMVKSGELAGFSVSGWFEEVADFCREEMFLHQVVEILKKY